MEQKREGKQSVCDEDIDDPERQHGADLLLSHAGAHKLLLGHPPVRIDVHLLRNKKERGVRKND